MGIDLAVLYDDHFETTKTVAGDTAKLHLGNSEKALDLVRGLPAPPAPQGTPRYPGDEVRGGGYVGPVDHYYKPLAYTLARDWHAIKPANWMSPRFRAALHYITELPDDAKIWLDWC